MIRYLYLIILILTCFASNSQTLDSVKYSQGYLYYHKFGKGVPIVMLSGGPGNSCEKELSIADSLKNNNLIIVIEQRGTGRSMPKLLDSSTINYKAYFDDINLVLKHLGCKKAIIYGHSMGGTTAISYASYFPEKVIALILSGTAIPEYGDKELQFTTRLNREARLGAAEWAKYDSLLDVIYVKKNGTKKDTIDFKRFYSFMNIYNYTTVDSLYTILSKTTSNDKVLFYMIADLEKKYKSIIGKMKLLKTPIYAICGRQDPIAFMSYELKIMLPKTELFWIQSSGHYPFIEQPEDFYSTIRTIIKKIKTTPNEALGRY